MKLPQILIIEDEKNIADALQRGLNENGFHTTATYSGENALELFKQEAFDLMLVDIQLGGINGFDVCRNVRLRNTSLGIIMLTSLHEMNNKTEGYEAGADDYIVKPIAFNELLLKINALLKRVIKGAAPVAPILVSNDLEMNLDSKEVKRGDCFINLTAREFRLLEYLMRNKNKVVSRADIAMHVWDIDFKTSTNVIDVYINYLRNKIDKNFASRLIHTQTGVGFILKENIN